MVLILLPCKSLQQSNERGKKRRKHYIPTNSQNVFLWQGRSYIRKGLEAYFTVLIEIIWGKERIMEVYLNSIKWKWCVWSASCGRTLV
jgi:monofunctional biosynthetic peptidoglycan transglycosylase